MEPEDVISPEGRWQQDKVIYSDKHGLRGGWSVAEGQWDNGGWRDVLAIRWNGKEGEKGNPQSRGQATWFILPDELQAAIRKAIRNEMEPEHVISPKGRWRQGEVIYRGEDEQWGGWSVAEGQWDNGGWRDVLGIRWDGKEGEKGNPQSWGRATWFILPSALQAAIRNEIAKLKETA